MKWALTNGKWGFVKREERKHVKKHVTRADDFALGLYLSGATCPPGACRTAEEIAIFVRATGAHCTRQRILQIEEKALRKLRHPEKIKKLR